MGNVETKQARVLTQVNPSNNKGIAEARPGRQVKSTRCNILIFGRLSAKGKNSRSHRRRRALEASEKKLYQSNIILKASE